MKKNILVFPCGSEIALEIHRSVKNSPFFNLIGASSVNDHGRFVYDNYISGLPFITDDDFLSRFKQVIEDCKIDAVYPAMDSVITLLKKNEAYLGCKVISSPVKTAEICLSKSLTYNTLKNVVLVPEVYAKVEDIENFPVFVKPDVGYGSRGTKKITNMGMLKDYLSENSSCLVSEYLPGDEYTVDCFSDSEGVLLFAKARERSRIVNGISVNTRFAEDNSVFLEMAKKINSRIVFNGAWFFQVKRNKNKELALLEVASRFGGSSALNRARGVNFALLSLFQSFGYAVKIEENNYDVEFDRALDNKYKINIFYNEVFVDFDDTVCLEKKYINTELIGFLFKCRNKGIKVTLLSKHDDEKYEPLDKMLEKLCIKQIFDRIIHINQNEEKRNYIDNVNSIFIDDSFSEREKIRTAFGIPVFSLDMIEVLV